MILNYLKFFCDMILNYLEIFVTYLKLPEKSLVT